MRNMFLIGLSAAGLLLLNASTALSAEAKSDSKTVTITGEGKCGKCALKETDSCQNVIQTKEDGKTVTYYIVKNDVSDKYHGTICKGTKKTTAKGTVKEVKGKKEFTVSEIKAAEESPK